MCNHFYTLFFGSFLSSPLPRESSCAHASCESTGTRIHPFHCFMVLERQETPEMLTMEKGVKNYHPRGVPSHLMLLLFLLFFLFPSRQFILMASNLMHLLTPPLRSYEKQSLKGIQNKWPLDHPVTRLTYWHWCSPCLASSYFSHHWDHSIMGSLLDATPSTRLRLGTRFELNHMVHSVESIPSIWLYAWFIAGTIWWSNCDWDCSISSGKQNACFPLTSVRIQEKPGKKDSLSLNSNSGASDVRAWNDTRYPLYREGDNGALLC